MVVWVHPRVFCCSIFSFLCSALQINICFLFFKPLGFMYSICFTMIDFPFDICKLLYPSIYGFCFLLIFPDYSFDIFWLVSLCYIPITLLVSSDHSSGIFWLTIRYLLIASSIFPDCSLVSCIFPFCIFWLLLSFLIPSSVSSDYPFCISWYPLCYLLISPSDIFQLFWWLLKLSITCWKKG